MKILLVGEYSNLHWTLAEGLRAVGHHVTVASNGDFWKNYPRDIDLARKPGRLGSLTYGAKLLAALPRMRGYDVVQLINPTFLELKAERLFSLYKYLRRHNTKVFLGAFGMDYYWVHENITRKPLRYSDFNIGPTLRENRDALVEQKNWIGTANERLNRMIAADCDGIAAGLYEYWACYAPLFGPKTRFIPMPIKPKKVEIAPQKGKVRVFIGINSARDAYKGTDIMRRAAEDLQRQFPAQMELIEVHDLPFAEYQKRLNNADILLDQLYSYTPGMNALEAMSRGIVAVGGGEPENYAILHEPELRPIINVMPNYESVYNALKEAITHPARLQKMKAESVEYIRKHHDYRTVAARYERLYNGQEDNL